jgi:hypothetical protein
VFTIGSDVPFEGLHHTGVDWGYGSSGGSFNCNNVNLEGNEMYLLTSSMLVEHKGSEVDNESL